MQALRTLGLVAALALPAVVPAQEQPGLNQRLELPAHRELMATSERASLAPFQSDGCSGGMSTIWTSLAAQFPKFAAVHGDLPPWEHCCRFHDRVYHNAGGARTAERSFAARQAADDDLRRCVLKTGDGDLSALSETYGLSEATLRQTYRSISDAMHLAVRIGGGPCSGLPWRWGYGYPECSVVFRTPDAPQDRADE